jgi:DNA-binding NarL/FixJ family response regulator
MHRILVVDDCKAWREAVCKIIDTHPGLEVIAQAANGLEAVRLAEALQPELVVLDIGLPSLNGLCAAARIFKISPTSKVIFVSQENDPVMVRAARGMGASAYIYKLDVGSQLLNAITTALDVLVSVPNRAVA